MSPRSVLLFLSLVSVAACSAGPDPQAEARAEAESLAGEYRAAVAREDVLEAERVGTRLRREHADSDAYRGLAPALDAVLARADALREEQRLRALWLYQAVAMPAGTQFSAQIAAMGSLPDGEDGAVAAASPTRLVLRRHPEWGQSVYLLLDSSELRCGPPCSVEVVVDDQPARRMPGRPADSGQGPALFIESDEEFIALLPEAQRISIRLPRQGVIAPSYGFEVGGFEMGRFEAGR
jgi:hypothetical protein